jgi:pimeloyl-ACP methyl ester carboxylesterase
MERASVRFDKVRLATGLGLHWAEQGDPDGEAVVFLHGWPDSWFSFSRVLPLLPRHLRALAVDQRGFGDSDRPESGYAIPNLAADVVAFLDALAIDRATLVGHSFGTFVARHLAITAPERVACVVLIGTGFTESNSVLRDLQRALRDLPDPVPVEFARDFQAGTVYCPLPAEFFERIVAESLKLPARLWREMIDRLVEYGDANQLPKITAPTLLLWGEKDALFSRADQDRFVAALPRANLTVYKETGHCPNWERPERVAEDIGAFVQGA